MDLPDRKRMEHRPPAWVKDGATFFVTINCRERGEVWLTVPACSAGLKASLAHVSKARGWRVSLCVLMPDHLHMLVSFQLDRSMGDEIKNWKRYTARTLKIVWQREFFDHRIRDARSFEEKWLYCMHNPVRRGLCVKADEWPFMWMAKDFE